MASSIKSNMTSFKVFYKDYENNVSISSSNPDLVNSDRIKFLAESLLQHADNFLGIIDRNDVILQAYLDDDEQYIFLELIFPESTNFLQTRMNWTDAFNFLANLPIEFSRDSLPNAESVK